MVGGIEVTSALFAGAGTVASTVSQVTAEALGKRYGPEMREAVLEGSDIVSDVFTIQDNMSGKAVLREVARKSAG